MRIRLHAGDDHASSVPQLLHALGFDAVEVHSSFPAAGADGVEPDGSADLVIWEVAADPEVSARELRYLLRTRERDHAPFIVLMPPGQLGLEMSVMRAGCEAVAHHPIGARRLARSIASLGRQLPLERSSIATDIATVLVIGVDETTPAAIRSALGAEGLAVLDRKSVV